MASVTKSITSTLVGLAIARGHIGEVQQPAPGFFPERAIAGLDARKRKQMLEHLLTMQSGWDCGVPLGIRDADWPADPQGNNFGWGDLQLHPRDMARIRGKRRRACKADDGRQTLGP